MHRVTKVLVVRRSFSGSWAPVISILGNEKEKRSLSEVRFSVMDPIVKGILRCTDTVVAAEEPISKSEPNKEKNINF